MSIKEIQDEIIKLKKEKDICILAHCYQNPEILEVAVLQVTVLDFLLKRQKLMQKQLLCVELDSWLNS